MVGVSPEWMLVYRLVLSKQTKKRWGLDGECSGLWTQRSRLSFRKDGRLRLYGRKRLNSETGKIAPGRLASNWSGKYIWEWGTNHCHYPGAWQIFSAPHPQNSNSTCLKARSCTSHRFSCDSVNQPGLGTTEVHGPQCVQEWGWRGDWWPNWAGVCGPLVVSYGDTMDLGWGC